MQIAQDSRRRNARRVPQKDERNGDADRRIVEIVRLDARAFESVDAQYEFAVDDRQLNRVISIRAQIVSSPLELRSFFARKIGARKLGEVATGARATVVKRSRRDVDRCPFGVELDEPCAGRPTR